MARSESSLNVAGENAEGARRTNGSASFGEMSKKKFIDTESLRGESTDATEVEGSVKVTELVENEIHDDDDDDDDDDDEDEDEELDAEASSSPKNEIEVKVSEVSETGTESVLTSTVFTVSSPKTIVDSPAFLPEVALKKKNSNGVTFGENVIHEADEDIPDATSVSRFIIREITGVIVCEVCSRVQGPVSMT